MDKSDRTLGGQLRSRSGDPVASEILHESLFVQQTKTYLDCYRWWLTDEERHQWCASSSPVLSALRVFSCGFFREAWGHWWERKDLPEGILTYCIEGKGYCLHDGVQCQVTAGDLLYCPPNTHHSYWADSEQPWTIYWMHLSGAQLDCYEQLLGLNRPDWRRYIGVNDSLIDDFKRLVGNPPQTGIASDWFCIQAMVIGILGRIAAVPQGTAEVVSAYGPIQNAIALMNASLNAPFDLASFAQAAGWGQRHFIRQFRQVTGLPPGEWFVRQRMRQACSLLTLPNIRVKQVAAHLNYVDPLYFSRVFKRVVGISPEQYQKEPVQCESLRSNPGGAVCLTRIS